MQVAFTTSKLIRTKTDIGNSPVSVAYAATKLAQQIHGNLNSVTALLIGAGETISLVAKHLKQSHIKEVVIANRTASNSRKIADICEGRIVELADIPREISKSDIVVSSVTSRTPIIERDVIELAVKKRHEKPIFLVDLGVPRNISGEVGMLESVYLYTVDDLKTIVESNIDSRRDAAIEAEQIVSFKATDYLEWMRVQDVSTTIANYRDKYFKMVEDELAQSRKALGRGANAEVELEKLALKLSKKLMHKPTTYLREHADDPETLKIAIELLDIEKEKK